MEEQNKKELIDILLQQIEKRDVAMEELIKVSYKMSENFNKTLRIAVISFLLAIFGILTVISCSYFFSDYDKTTTNSNYNENKNVNENIGGVE